jgi:hypothetical protein
MESEALLEVAKYKMISLSECLLILNSEQQITDSTYQYLNDKVLLTLHNIVYAEMEKLENEQKRDS